MPIFLPNIDWRSNVNKTALVQVASIPRNTRPDRNIHRHCQSKQNDRGEAEVPEVVGQTAPDHLNDIGQTGNMNSKIFLIELVHDSLEMLDRLLGVLAFHEHDDIAGSAVRSDQEAAPKWARQRVCKILRSRGQTLDGANRINRVDLLSEFLDPTEVAR